MNVPYEIHDESSEVKSGRVVVSSSFCGVLKTSVLGFVEWSLFFKNVEDKLGIYGVLKM